MTDTPLSDDVVERVAEAMCAAINGDKSSVVQWSKLHREERELYEIAARAALEAARYGEMVECLREMRTLFGAMPEPDNSAYFGEALAAMKRVDALLSSIGASQP